MPSLALKPPRPPGPYHHSDSNPPDQDSITVSQPQFHRSSSPVAPAFSPITPKLQPHLPVKPQLPFVPPENGTDFTFSAGNMSTPQPDKAPAQPMTPTAQYIPQPPNLPFSSDEATDAIALRAAISTLQFQKKKAQDDLKKLENIKQLALDEPDQFKTQLAAGKLKEQRPTIGNLQAILDEEGGSDDDESVVFGAQEDEDDRKQSQSPDVLAEIPDSQPSRPVSRAHPAQQTDNMEVDKRTAFPQIPGPQTVVRMPHVNWDKYGIVGEALDSLHEQQRRWPGSAPFQQDRGREHAIAAPYSPFLDRLDTNQHARASSMDESRKDSAAFTPTSATVSEHPMETRSRG